LTNIAIRDARAENYPAVVKLNEAVVEQTSPMVLERLNQLVTLTSYFRVAVTVDRLVAFLLAMREGVPYQNDNYSWFTSRYDRFLYVDRVVVASEFQGCGIGTKLYRNLFSYAMQEEVPVITCEINAVPPNEVSAAFHARLGFSEVGSQWICEGRKKVSMQAALL